MTLFETITKNIRDMKMTINLVLAFCAIPIVIILAFIQGLYCNIKAIVNSFNK